MRIPIAAAILGLAFIIAIFFASNALKYKSKTTETIVVTGLAEKDFVSDLIVWQGDFARRAPDLQSAYAALKSDENTIREYLRGKGISDVEMVFTAVNINKEYNTRYNENGMQLGQEFIGYNLSQTIKVQSKDVDKVEKLSREATEIIQRGIELNSYAPAYYYSKLNDVKIELLGKASADARNRASTIAQNSNTSLGDLRKATMGVFQITGKNSNEDYSYGGAFNTTDKMKTGSVTIRAEYAVD